MDIATRIGNAIGRFAGKKFFMFMVTAVFFAVIGNYAMTFEAEDSTVRVIEAVCWGFAIAVAGLGIGQGIGDTGRRNGTTTTTDTTTDGTTDGATPPQA